MMIDEVSALLIGCSVYSDESFDNLDACVVDAETMESQLKGAFSSVGVKTRVLRSPTGGEVGDGLRWLYQDGAGGLHILYLSGHGHRSGTGRTYFASSDSTPERPEGMLSGEQLCEVASWAGRGAQHLWIFDFCFSEGLAFPATVVESAILDLTVLASGSARARTVAKQETFDAIVTPLDEMSHFSRSIMLALRGIGEASSVRESVSVAEIADVVVMENLRLGYPPSWMIRRGSGVGERIPLPRPPRLRMESVHLITDAVNRTPSVVVGTDGIRALAIASQLAPRDQMAIVDGRSPLQLDMTMRLVGAMDRSRSIVVEGIGEEEVLADVLRILESERRVGIVSPQLKLALPETVSSVEVPPLGEAEAMDWLRTRVGFETLGVSPEHDGIVEAALGRAGDSLEVFGALVASKLTATRDGEHGGDQLVLPLGGSNPEAVVEEVLAILRAAHGVFLPTRLVKQYISGTKGFSRDEIEWVMSALHRNMMIEIVGVWCRMSSPVRELVDQGISNVGRPRFCAFLQATFDEGESLERVQLLRGASAVIHESVRDEAVPDDVVRLISRIGLDLTHIAGADAFVRLMARLIEVRNGDIPSRLSIFHGHALRLGDQYEEATAQFAAARRTARAKRDRLAADVGRVAALKNASTRRSELIAFRDQIKAGSGTVGGDPVVAREFAGAYFQQANVLFSSSRWAEAAELYSTALECISANEVENQSLAVDILKGLGDIALHRDDLEMATRLATTILNICAHGTLSLLEPKCHAKTMQYVGDLHRRLTVRGQSGLSRVHVDAAEYWLARALTVYSANGLRLGELMSHFKMTQCRALTGKLDEAAGVHMQLVTEFEGLQNHLWKYRSAVMAALEGSMAGKSVDSQAMKLLMDCIEGELDKGMSPYQEGWGKLVRSVIRGESRDEPCRLFDSVGATELASRLRRGVGYWITAYY